MGMVTATRPTAIIPTVIILTVIDTGIIRTALAFGPLFTSRARTTGPARAAISGDATESSPPRAFDELAGKILSAHLFFAASGALRAGVIVNAGVELDEGEFPGA